MYSTMRRHRARHKTHHDRTPPAPAVWSDIFRPAAKAAEGGA